MAGTMAGRAGSLAAWTGALMLGTVGLGMPLWRTGLGVAGIAMGLLCAWAWRERARPHGSLAWWLVGLPVPFVVLFAPEWSPLLLGWIAGDLVMLDDRRAPGALILAGLLAVAWRGGWPGAGEAEAWWLAFAGLLVVTAAMWERERLAAPTGLGAGTLWTLARASLLGIWTVVVMLLHDAVHPAAWIPTAILDPGRASGRVALAGIIVLALAATAVLWRRVDAPEHS